MVELIARKTEIKEIKAGIYEIRQIQKHKDQGSSAAVIWLTEEELISIGQTASLMAVKRKHQEKTDADRV